MSDEKQESDVYQLFCDNALTALLLGCNMVEVRATRFAAQRASLKRHTLVVMSLLYGVYGGSSALTVIGLCKPLANTVMSKDIC